MYPRFAFPALAGVVACAVWAGAVVAGPVSDAETALRAAYGHYRTALFATNTNAPDKAAAELVSFGAAWTALQPVLAAAPQYDGDTALSATFDTVAALAAEAGAAVGAGDMAKAHERLEAVRGEIAGLHDRAGIFGFSDRMNAYHAAMEAALALTPDQIASPAGMEAAAEKAGLLEAYAADIAAHPAPEAAAAEYAGLSAGFQSSVKAYVDAVRSGDAAAIVKATGGLKPAYSKFFVLFG